MTVRYVVSLALLGALLAAAPAMGAGHVGALTQAPRATVPALYDNCTAYNKKYPHGVGRANAKDKTKSRTAKPVTTFKRSNALYKTAMKYNADLDRDDDGIACERA
jgi:hypothetical protein